MKACLYCGCTEIAACLVDDRPCAWSSHFSDRVPICTACEADTIMLIRLYGSRLGDHSLADTPGPPPVLVSGAAARALNSAAIGAVLAERLAQVERFGHDPDGDVLLSLDDLPRKAWEYLQIGRDCIRATGEKRDLPRARKKLVQSAALILAALDRLSAGSAL